MSSKNALKLYEMYLVSTPLMKVENTRHFPSVEVVARSIYKIIKRSK